VSDKWDCLTCGDEQYHDIFVDPGKSITAKCCKCSREHTVDVSFGARMARLKEPKQLNMTENGGL